MGKTVSLPAPPSGAPQTHTEKDASLALRGHESGVIDQVGFFFVRVKPYEWVNG